MHLNHRITARVARASLLAALVFAVTAQVPSPAPDVRLSFVDPVFSFPATCDLSKPVAFMAVHAKNFDTVTAGFAVGATDASGMLAGGVSVAPLAPGASTTVSIPLMRAGSATAATLPGQHVVSAFVKGRPTIIALGFAFPAGFCPPGVTPTNPPASGSSQTFSIAGEKSRNAAIYASIKIAPPTGLRTVASGTDCGAHVGPIGALVCPDMMKSGDLLLIWNWHAGEGIDAIDGYRIYTGNGVNVNNGDFVGQLLASHAGGGQTLFDVPKPKDGKGYGGRCYAVTAYAGARESKPSAPFCAGGGEVAQKATFAPVRQVSIMRSSFNRDELATTDNLAHGYAKVGFRYDTYKHLFGDHEAADISRYALQFDVARIAGRKVFEAHLTLDILSNSLSRLDCTTSVALGTSNWWTDRWPDAPSFTSADMTVKNNQLTIDLTNPVINWANGRFNQGIILRNDDENLNAFQDKSCESYYRNPVLTVTYY